MRLFRRLLFERIHLRRAISIATAVLYSFLVFGVPLPAAVRKRGDVPFPCQDNACGCATAEQCWRSCCCTTPAERFAWAQRHGVTPPEYAVPPESGWRSTPEREQPKKQCCTVKKTCCETETSHEPAQQPDEQRSQQPEEQPDESSPDESSPRVTFVLGLAAQKCQGLTAMGANAGLVAVPTVWITWQPIFHPLGWVDTPTLLAEPDASLPPLQPPRVFTV